MGILPDLREKEFNLSLLSYVSDIFFIDAVYQVEKILFYS